MNIWISCWKKQRQTTSVTQLQAGGADELKKKALLSPGFLTEWFFFSPKKPSGLHLKRFIKWDLDSCLWKPRVQNCWDSSHRLCRAETIGIYPVHKPLPPLPRTMGTHTQPFFLPLQTRQRQKTWTLSPSSVAGAGVTWQHCSLDG